MVASRGDTDCLGQRLHGRDDGARISSSLGQIHPVAQCCRSADNAARNGRARSCDDFDGDRLGAADREKNVAEIIRAVAKLRQSLPGLTYEIAGDGPLQPELEALAKELGAGDIVKFLGFITDGELDKAYARASVFALPSAKEGFGIVYLEAWQRGLPVICSSEGASKEIVEDGVDGFVVDPADVSILADRLHLLLSQPGRAKAMGERGRRKVEANYLNPVFKANLGRLIDDLRGRTF